MTNTEFLKPGILINNSISYHFYLFIIFTFFNLGQQKEFIPKNEVFPL